MLKTSLFCSHILRHTALAPLKGRSAGLFLQTFSSMPSAAPRPVVLSGPSGCGKSTLITRLMEDVGKHTIGFSVSHTTRAPRPGETNGIHYHFVTKEEFDAALKNGELLENAVFSGNCYGTSRKAVKDVMKAKKLCLLDIDSQGVKNVKKTDLNPVYVFIRPPNLSVLEQRLRSRGTETEEAIEKRLNAAGAEMAYGDTAGNYDFIVVNDNLDVAYSQLKSIIEQVMRDNNFAE